MKVIFVSSHGGHWKQLQRISCHFKDYSVLHVTTKNTSNNDFLITDCNQNQPLKLIKCFFESLLIVKNARPTMIVTTGAAPGLMMLLAGKFVKSELIWIDSIANSEKLSLSGRLAKYLTRHVLTQWETVSKKENVKFFGRVL